MNAFHSLVQVDLFRPLDERERQDLERRCRWKWWKSGATIIGQAAGSECVYFVAAGRCRVETLMGKARGIVLDEVGAGGYFGEIAAIDGEPRSATVVAVGTTLTGEMDGPLFRDFLAKHPEASMLAMRRLTEMIRQSDDKIMELCGLDARARICSELLRQAKTGPNLPDNAAFVRPIPVHSAIAARVSTTRETVARVLAELGRRQLFRREHDALIITDLVAVHRMIGNGQDRSARKASRSRTSAPLSPA